MKWANTQGFVKMVDDEKKNVLLTYEGKQTMKILKKHENFKKEIFDDFDENFRI